MKNKSYLYPFETMEDPLFDIHKDGELDKNETMLRDKYIYDRINEFDDNETKICLENTKKPFLKVKPEHADFVLFYSFFTLVIIFLSFMAILFIENDAIGKLVFIIGTIIATIFFVNGLNKPKE